MPATESASIIAHPDVKRMLMTIAPLTQAARSVLLPRHRNGARSRRTRHRQSRPRGSARPHFVADAAVPGVSSDIGIEVASLGTIQVHGGMGFIEETGAAQFYRDARIAPDL